MQPRPRQAIINFHAFQRKFATSKDLRWGALEQGQKCWEQDPSFKATSTRNVLIIKSYLDLPLLKVQDLISNFWIKSWAPGMINFRPNFRPKRQPKTQENAFSDWNEGRNFQGPDCGCLIAPAYEHVYTSHFASWCSHTHGCLTVFMCMSVSLLHTQITISPLAKCENDLIRYGN